MEHTAPGFRFYPTEEELITFYLHNKLHGHGLDLERIIPSIDIYNFEPHLLPGLAGQACQGDMEQWFFFAPQQEREARGGRTNRTTVSGYWKATGTPSHVYSQNDNRVIGMKKTMVFYKGKAPNGRKTKWKMNEYKAIIHQENLVNNDATKVIVASSSSNVPQLRHEISLCRVYVTSKCARSFDRRPAPETRTTTTTTTTTMNMSAQHATINISNINQELGSSSGIGTSSQSINATTFLSIEGSSSSTDSANSEGNNNNNVQGQETLQNQVGSTSNNFEDIESLWDSWDQLNWP